MSSFSENFGNKVDAGFASFFHKVGSFVGGKPRLTLVLCIALTVVCGSGFVRWETESRGEKLWVPQGTVADQEEMMYLEYFPNNARFNQMIMQSSSGSNSNVLTKELLILSMQMHLNVQTKQAVIEDEGSFDFVDLCAMGGGSCATTTTSNTTTTTTGVCQCLISSILRQWNYNLETLQNDENYMETLNEYGTRADLEAVLGKPLFDDNDQVTSAEAFTLSYFLQDRSVVENGEEVDPINEGWEEQVFLEVAESPPIQLTVDYFAGRSFADEFGNAITGDLALVQVSYVVAFLFLGATMGRIRCGTGSRWTLALAALAMVGLSTAAGFGIAALCGLFYGPVHSLLPFVLLGIGADDAFVIVNAFDRARKVPRAQETNEGIMMRSGKALSRAGASITVTSMTDLVAFAISSSSALPALASFCAYAAICIFFLWLFAATFFTAALVIDERRQRDNRRECVCCVTRNGELKEDGDVFEEGLVAKYFRSYHAPAILSKPGKLIVFAIFAGIFGFGIYGALNLAVEDSTRNFVPSDSYLADYIDAGDEFFPSQGADLYIVFEGSEEIYGSRQELSELETRLTDLSTTPPYISEPISEESYRNVMEGFAKYLNETGWPTTQADFVSTLAQYASFTGPGAVYAQDVSFSANGTELEAIRVKLEYVKLIKTQRGEEIADADKLIDAMDSTRLLVDSWDDLPSAFPYSVDFLVIEGFKIIRQELFRNVGLAIAAVGVIVFFTVASPVTALLITMNVAFCIVEILGFMWAIGIVIDSVSVINIVLAVGLSVDYSAHVGHCFMVKGGSDKDKRVTESLADVGSAVMKGGISTFLAVAVLLFSSSYVFAILSKQFALTVILGLLHGLVALPVMLSVLGPPPFSSAEEPEESETKASNKIEETAHPTGHPVVDSISGEGAK